MENSDLDQEGEPKMNHDAGDVRAMRGAINTFVQSVHDASTCRPDQLAAGNRVFRYPTPYAHTCRQRLKTDPYDGADSSDRRNTVTW